MSGPHYPGRWPTDAPEHTARWPQYFAIGTYKTFTDEDNLRRQSDKEYSLEKANLHNIHDNQEEHLDGGKASRVSPRRGGPRRRRLARSCLKVGPTSLTRLRIRKPLCITRTSTS